jgi:hypothetical protein
VDLKNINIIIVTSYDNQNSWKQKLKQKKREKNHGKRKKNEPERGVSWAACSLPLINERSYACASSGKKRNRPSSARRSKLQTAPENELRARVRDNYGDRRRHTSSCPFPATRTHHIRYARPFSSFAAVQN